MEQVRREVVEGEDRVKNSCAPSLGRLFLQPQGSEFQIVIHSVVSALGPAYIWGRRPVQGGARLWEK